MCHCAQLLLVHGRIRVDCGEGETGSGGERVGRESGGGRGREGGRRRERKRERNNALFSHMLMLV